MLENVLEELSYVLEHTAEEQSSWGVGSSVNRNRYNAPGMMHLLQQLKWWAVSPVYNCRLLRICQNISFILHDSCNGLLVLFNWRYFSYLPSKMAKLLFRNLPSLLTWVTHHICLEFKPRESLIKWNLPLLASFTSTNYSSWSPVLTGDQRTYHGKENVDSRHSRGRGGETTRFHTVNVAQPVRFSSKLQTGKSGASFCYLIYKFRLFLN